MQQQEKNWRVLVADDEVNNLKLLRQILKDQYHISCVQNGAEAVAAARELKPDLILLDIMMPDMDGYEACRRLKSDPQTAAIPVIFVTAKSELEDEKLGFDVGAVDYIIKPVSAPIVRARVGTHLQLYDQQRATEIQVQKRTKELAASQRAAIEMLGHAGHYNDNDTGYHIWRMADYAAAIARKAGWTVARAKQLQYAAPMHDMGKIGIPDSILKKPGKLDAEEWDIMKTHSLIGYQILSEGNTPLFRMAADIAYAHHEKWDGSGYPRGLAGKDIPESARIVAIADVFDALTMTRPYKSAWPVNDAFSEILKMSGHHLDPDLVDCFMAIKDEILDIKFNWDQKEVLGDQSSVEQAVGNG